MRIIRDFIILNKEIPAAFIASSSSLSPKFPNVIKEPKRMDSGRANGTTDKAAYKKNSPRTETPTPFPTKSST